ncbi:hypothetical protein [Bifidobacterium sp.]
MAVGWLSDGYRFASVRLSDGYRFVDDGMAVARPCQTERDIAHPV